MSFELAKLQIEANMPLENIKDSLDRAYKAEHRQEFNAVMRAEYVEMFPEWSDEINTILAEPLGLLDGTTQTIVYDSETLEYTYRELIDYSDNPDYLTLQEYINETKTVLIGTETLMDDNGVAYESEIFEEQLVRPYVEPLQSDIDALVDAWLTDIGYVSKEQKDALKYLADTDWYVVRYAEQGIIVPEEVTLKRQEARLVL